MNEKDDNVTPFRLIQGGAGDLTVNQVVDTVIYLTLTRYVGGRALVRVARELGYELDQRSARRIIMGSRTVLRLVLPPRRPRNRTASPNDMTVRQLVIATNEWLIETIPQVTSWLEKKSHR